MPAIEAPMNTLANRRSESLTLAWLKMKKAMAQPTMAAMTEAVMRRASYQRGTGRRSASIPTKCILQMPSPMASAPL